MIASASHDMRTPLNTIINMHKMIKKKTTSQQVQNWLNIANNSTNLLLFLVNDTLDYFQIKSGKFTARIEKTNINELVKNCFDLIII